MPANFVNPYNFVSIDEPVLRSEYSNGDLSGVITCTLRTQTPLIIPDNGRATNVAGHKEYGFFTVNNNPVIPGSSLRGMIRSAYETITNSCLSTADDENILYKRTGVPKTPGIIIQNPVTKERKLWSADRVMLNMARHYGKNSSFGADQSANRNNYKTGQKVWIKLTEKTYGETRGRPFITVKGVEDISLTDNPEFIKEGYILLGENFQRKHHDSVFIKTGEQEIKDVNADEYKRLRQVWELYQRKEDKNYNGVNQTARNSPVYDNYPDQPYMPVFYREIDGVYYMSPACITKEVFSHTINSLLLHQGGHNPCNQSDHPDEVCPACALFGTVQTKNAIASRIMVRDAERRSGVLRARITLPILGNPKVSATEFYMHPVGDTDYWNYDYSTQYTYRENGDLDKNGTQEQQIAAKLRGRKNYWHSVSTLGEIQKSKLNGTFTAIDNGEFSFDIAFEKITMEELRTLIWAISFGRYWDQENSGDYAHKLGHGKPVGFGSVKIDVDNITTFKLDKNDYTIQSDHLSSNDVSNWTPSDEMVSIREYKRIHDFSNRPADVSYPAGRDKNGNITIYQWFSNNKGKMDAPTFEYYLPFATDENVSLPKLPVNPGTPPRNPPQRRVRTQNEQHGQNTQNAQQEAFAAPVLLPNTTNRETEKKISRLIELTERAREPKHAQDFSPKKDNDKLRAYLEKNPMPENASSDLKKAYDKAKEKLVEIGG